MRACGSSPRSSARSSDITSDGGGAVVERAGVPGRDPAARLNTGFSSASFSSVVPRRGPSSVSTTVPSASGYGVISRSKKPDLLRRDRAVLRALRVLVHVLPRDVVLVGDVLGRQAHRDVDVRDRGVVDEQLGFISSCSWEAGDLRLDSTAAGDEAVALAGLDRVERHADRLQGRRAGAVDPRARGRVSGRPARSARYGRGSFPACAAVAEPIMTSTISAGSTAGTFSIRRSMMKPPMSSGRTSFSEPLRARPIGRAGGLDDDGFGHSEPPLERRDACIQHSVGQQGHLEPRSRSSTARVTARGPKRSRTSSSAASSAPPVCGVERQRELDDASSSRFATAMPTSVSPRRSMIGLARASRPRATAEDRRAVCAVARGSVCERVARVKSSKRSAEHDRAADAVAPPACRRVTRSTSPTRIASISSRRAARAAERALRADRAAPAADAAPAAGRGCGRARAGAGPTPGRASRRAPPRRARRPRRRS